MKGFVTSLRWPQFNLLFTKCPLRISPSHQPCKALIALSKKDHPELMPRASHRKQVLPYTLLKNQGCKSHEHTRNQQNAHLITLGESAITSISSSNWRISMQTLLLHGLRLCQSCRWTLNWEHHEADLKAN